MQYRSQGKRGAKERTGAREREREMGYIQSCYWDGETYVKESRIAVADDVKELAEKEAGKQVHQGRATKIARVGKQATERKGKEREMRCCVCYRDEISSSCLSFVVHERRHDLLVWVNGDGSSISLAVTVLTRFASPSFSLSLS